MRAVYSRQMTSGASGGIWVRNWTDRVESRNIRFQNCEFYKSGADELLAVWGWGGAVRDVVLSGCSFYETQTQEALDADHRRCGSSRWGRAAPQTSGWRIAPSVRSIARPFSVW